MIDIYRPLHKKRPRGSWVAHKPYAVLRGKKQPDRVVVEDEVAARHYGVFRGPHEVIYAPRWTPNASLLPGGRERSMGGRCPASGSWPTGTRSRGWSTSSGRRLWFENGWVMS